MVCKSAKAITIFAVALSLLTSTSYSFVSAISEDEIDKFLDNLRVTTNLDNDMIENLHSPLSFLVTLCPSIKLQDAVKEVLNVDTCEDILDPFYQPDGGNLKSTQVLCESQAEITKSVSSAVYCTFHPMIKILQNCLASVTTTENIDLMNSITMNMTMESTKEVLDTTFKVICKREDTIERLGDLISEIGFFDAISLMSCRSELLEAKSGKGKVPAFVQTYAECLVKQMNAMGQGLCGLFGNINWQEYTKCLGDDIQVCGSETATKILAYIFQNDEIYELLDKFLCKLQDNNSLYNMFDNLLYKSTGYKLTKGKVYPSLGAPFAGSTATENSARVEL